VAWATFTTGTNPGGHGIFDFISRDPKTCTPQLALTRYEQKSAFLPPQAVNLRHGMPVWELLSKAGIPSTVLRCPCTFPPDNIRGQMLAGVGVPDLRGGQGTPTFYSSDKTVESQESENVVHLQTNGRGAIATSLIGPRNPKTRADFKFELSLFAEPEARRIVIRSEGKPEKLEVREGKWSDWLKVKFKIGPLQAVRGMVRFYLVRLTPVLEFYASPVNFDTDAPLFPISSPPEYAQELASQLGTFYTSGMVEDHAGVVNGRIGEASFLDQCEYVLRERERMMLHELDRAKEGFFFCLFDTPDRLQHVFWRFREREHPANRVDFSPDLAHVIQDHYRSLDVIVGRAFQYADDQTLFIVASDHGMNSFQRGLHLNTWLYETGLLALQNGVKPGEEAGNFFSRVDWSRTRAYALGLGGIYLNLKGREEKGIVDPDEAASVKSAIVRGLAGLPDPDRGQIAIRSVVTREQVYSGPYTGESPDLYVNFAAGYRASWNTPLGAVPAGLFEDNNKKWGGDHVIDPGLVPGVLFMNRAFRQDDAGLEDLAPTILAALGVPKGPAMEGETLL
jgi:predicted AlkP superfamily phosphohydrolase/phosphomutase